MPKIIEQVKEFFGTRPASAELTQTRLSHQERQFEAGVLTGDVKDRFAA